MVFTNDQVSAFIQSDVTALSNASIETLTADNVSHLSSTQMGFFSADQMSHFTSQATGAIVAIQGITPTAIVGVNLTALTGSQVASLLDTQIYALFTNKKLSALSPTQLGNFTYDQMNTFFSPYTNTTDTLGLVQLNDFSAAQVQALGTNLVIEANHFTAAIVTYMSAATQSSGAFSFMNKLSNAQLAALTTNAATTVSGSTGQIKAITAGQFASFSASQMGAFTALQAADFLSDQFLALTSTNIAGISTTAFPSIPSGISATYFNGISSTQLSGITTGQIAVMTNNQVTQLPASAVSSASGVYVPSSAQIGALSITGTTSQVASLTAAFVDAFSTTQLNYFSASQVPKIIVAAISGLSASQVSGLSATFAYALTTTAAGQLQSIVGANNTTSYDTLNAINVQDLKDHIVNLTDEQINKLSVAQIGNLTAGTNDTVATAYDQIAALSTGSGSVANNNYTAGKMATLFTEAQINAITPNQFKSINADEFSKFSLTTGSFTTTTTTPANITVNTDHIASFKNTAIANLSTAQFAKITANNIIKFKVGSWTTTAYTAAVTYGDIQSIPAGRIGELTAAQLGALTTTQIPALSLAQIAALPTTSAMSGLKDTQVQALHYGESGYPNQVAAITSNTFNALTYTQMNFFSALSSGIQVPSISTSAISNISASSLNGDTNKVVMLNKDFISSLWGSQLQAMSLTQVQQITATSLTNTQIISNATGASGATGGFRDEQIAWLTLSQVGLLVTSQLTGLVGTRTNITAGNYPYGRLNNLKIDCLKLDPTSTLSAGDYFPLSAVQVGQLSPANVKLLTSVHLRSFNSDRVQALTIADVDATQIPYIPGNDNSATTVNNGTNYAETIAVVNYASTNTSITATDFSSYASTNPAVINTAGTISFFSIDQILGMSQAQVKKLTYGQLSKFSQSQIRILNTTYLLASQIPYITINFLSDYQTGNLTKGQMLYISATQAAALSYATVTDGDTIKLKAGSTDATITANGVSATVSPTATAYGQIAVLSEQQMKWFREDVVSSFIADQINIVFANGVNNGANKFLSLPDAQYQLLKMKEFIENNTSNGVVITPVQISLETEFQNLARTGTSVKLGITGLTTLTMINKIDSTYDNVNSTSKIPDTVLHMISVTQVPFLSASRITTLKQSSKYSLLSNEVQLALDKNLLAYSTYATLKSYITTNGILSSASSIGTTTALYAQVKNLSEDLKAALLTDITNGNVGVNTVISSTLTIDADGILQPTTVEIVWSNYNIGSATNSQIASITPDNFALIPAVGDGQSPSGFANLAGKASAILSGQAAKMTVAQVKELTTTSIAALSSSVIANFTNDVLTNMSAAQINAMTEAQMSALTPEEKTILINIIDGGITALNIDLTGFDTSVSAALLSATKSDAIALGSFDATATANMTIADAKGMFKYADGGNGKIRLYLDKSYFKIKYAYQDSASVTVDHSDSEYNTNAQTFTYPSLHWAAPVTANDIAGVTTKVTPLSWDFIHYLASKVYGKYAAFSIFNDLNTKEAELRSTINTQVQATLSPIINAFDKVNATSTTAGYTFTKVSDGSEYYYELDPAITSGESKDIMSVIFNTLYKNQPARFMPVTGTVNNTKYDMPFIVGDKLQFIVSITPNPQQKVLDTASATTLNAPIPARKYKIEIAISA